MPALTPGQRTPVHIVQEAGWTPQPVWTQRLEEKSFVSAWDRTKLAGRPVRSQIRMWTAVTNGPIVHSPGDIWALITMVEWCRQRKTSDSSTRALWQSYPQSHLVESGRNGRRKSWIWPWVAFLFILASDFLNSVKSYHMGPLALLPFQRKAYWGFLSLLRISHLCRVWARKLWI
jgi:hypothetical protein